VQFAVVLVLAAIAAGCTSITPTRTASSSARSATPTSPSPSAQPSPIAGGCEVTQVYAGPGPDAARGLSGNPWAEASPADSGVIAYFFRPPPDLLVVHPASEEAKNKILWIVHGSATGDLTVRAHPDGAASPVVKFTVPGGGGYPSLINLPSLGCWHLDVSVGSVAAGLDLVVSPGPN
jgi:hypothetical protein